MSTPSTSRSRASLALGTALAITAASLTIGISPASADDVVYAKVSSHEKFSSDANKVGYWCTGGGTKIDPGGNSYVLPAGTYSQVIVKAGSGKYSNTIFADLVKPPMAGQTVWADTNGDGVFNPGGQGGDKNISHIILCDGTVQPPPTTDLTVDKVWEYLGEQPEGFELGNEDAGTLTVTVDDVSTVEAWGKPKVGLRLEAFAKVLEGAVPDPIDPKGYECKITGKPTYSVNGATPPVTVSEAFKLESTSNTVVVTNSVTCTPGITEPETGAVEAEKKWNVTGLDQKTAGGFVAGKPGTLTFNDVVKPWTDNTTPYAEGTAVKVIEAAGGTPPTATGYTCTIGTAATTYTVGGTTSTTPPTVTVEANTTVKVTITNTADCASTTPPAVIPPVVTPPAVTPPVVTPSAPEVDEADVAAEEDVVEEESAVAGSEDELADTGANLTGGLGAILILAGAALIAARRFAIK